MIAKRPCETVSGFHQFYAFNSCFHCKYINSPQGVRYTVSAIHTLIFLRCLIVSDHTVNGVRLALHREKPQNQTVP